MGYQTDYLGYLQIEPPLEDHEISLINRISGSPFRAESASVLRVADEEDAVLRELMRDSPRGWSNWSVCSQGCCLSYDGGDKANHMVPWLSFLMEALLVARGHVLTGMVVGSRRDTRELFAISVRRNDVEVELLWPGNPKWSDYPRLAHQIEIDRVRAWIADYRSAGGNS